MRLFGSERAWLEPNALKRVWLYLWGWRQVGPRIRYGHLLKGISGRKPVRVLEAGCGWGQNLFALHRCFPQAQLMGVDADAQALALAAAIARFLPKADIRFICARLPELPVEGLFDVVLVVDVLEYIGEEETTLQRLNEALAENGLLLLHVPRRVSEQRCLLGVSHGICGHVRPEYTREEIAAKVAAAGFHLLSVRATFGFWGTLAWELGRLSERMGVLAIVFPLLLPFIWLDVATAPKDGNGYLVMAAKESRQ